MAAIHALLLAVLGFLGPPGTYLILEPDGVWRYRYGRFDERGWQPLIGPPFVPPDPPPKPVVISSPTYPFA